MCCCRVCPNWGSSIAPADESIGASVDMVVSIGASVAGAAEAAGAAVVTASLSSLPQAAAVSDRAATAASAKRVRREGEMFTVNSWV